jgi:glycosyltransferase involved in cell wall biosynthesis
MVDLIIPTYGRHENLRALTLEIARCAGAEFRIFFVINPTDTQTENVIVELCKEHDFISILKTESKDISEIVQFGYEKTSSEYVMFLADDLGFPQGFLKTALGDIGDKALLAIASTECHGWSWFMVKRSYVEEHSLVCGTTNRVMASGYCRMAEAELVFTMQSRGQIAYASFTFDHADPSLYGYLQRGVVSRKKWLLTDLSIPFCDIEVRVIKNEDTGLNNVLEIGFVPRNPIVVGDSYKAYSNEEHIKDCAVLASRAHLWGGKTRQDVFFKRLENFKCQKSV